ncbi:metallophosphoesterase family protein [Sulfitobacter sp. JB4-11]|uniref:metallophosphoesterase family protein n=1 Tax=Sulfitobacter rhodophyticola TaxID=3238304 RepID=UPI003516D33E
MTRFIHLTDLHVSHPGAGDAKATATGLETLRQAIVAINAMDPQPDFVVASGDLTNMGDERSYTLLKETLAPLKAPLIPALGNHDRRAGYHAVFGAGPSDAPLFSSQTIAGLHIIALDTMIPNHVAGTIDDAQFQMLDTALADNADLPKLIVMHHPPRVDDAGLPWGSIDMPATHRLAETLQPHRIAAILSGHIHINQMSLWHGIPILVSTGLDSTIDLLERVDLRIMEGAGFTICTYRDSGITASYVSLLPEARELGVIDRARLLKFT